MEKESFSGRSMEGMGSGDRAEKAVQDFRVAADRETERLAKEAALGNEESAQKLRQLRQNLDRSKGFN